MAVPGYQMLSRRCMTHGVARCAGEKAKVCDLRGQEVVVKTARGAARDSIIRNGKK